MPEAIAEIARAEALVFAAGVNCAESALLQDTARANRADSLILKAHAQEVRGARRLHGASDHPEPDEPSLIVLITSVILDRPTCLLCLAAKVGATKLGVVRAMERIAVTVQIATAMDDRCRACGNTLGQVYSLIRRK